ncbi:batten's disease protein Cln3 [Phanerochaete sordida]|uniref:Protein BTN n=1 Tax=Phanerochaete sordida TaxID=48140 RepID=A0A9P3GC87_9APHY|nr:batten's disease protein Cln3 [Phanerochaete sordida]
MESNTTFEDRANETTAPLLREGGLGGSVPASARKLLFKLGCSFFLFGLINNVLYVVILSAALDLVPPSTPKGIIAFCNIFPALVAKVGWPYILKGRIRYAKRLIGCCAISVSGMIVVALFDSLGMRLLGICFASFSSGLGELTFLQLSTRYHPPSVGGQSLGYFSAGTGAAGLVGASLWWIVRGLGVRTGVGISSILPFAIPLAYYLLLPQPEVFAALPIFSADEEEETTLIAAEYTAVPTDDEDVPVIPKSAVALSLPDKWELVKPLMLKYMVPLFCVYLFEYTINQGVAPTLVYPVPSPDRYPLLSRIIHSIRDYYPLWQLVYQTTVFISRSSISLGFPPLPPRLLSLPAFVQAGILTILAVESAAGIFGDDSEALSFSLVFLLISLEGFCGGLAYVNVFYRLNQERPPVVNGDHERAKQEHEFKIGSIGFADSMGILLAAVAAVPTEVELCRAQVARGKTICTSL